MPVTLASQQVARDTGKYGFGFALVIIYLLFEYGRPQDKIPFLGMLRPGIVLMVLMVISWPKSGKLHQLGNAQFLHMLFFLFLMAVHVPFAYNSFYSYKVTTAFFLYFPMCISIMLFVNNFSKLRAFMTWWCILAAYIAINSIVNRGQAGSSFLSDENDVSLLINMMLPFALCLFFTTKQKGVKLFYLAVALACVAGVVMSRSRGGLVGLIVVMGVMWLASPKKILSMVLVLVLALGVYVSADEKYWDRMGTIDDTGEGTAKQRLDAWSGGWEMFKDNPQGVGPGNFPAQFPKYQPGDNVNLWGMAAHSIWFTLLPELGIPGLLLYFSLMIKNFIDIRFLRNLPHQNDDFRFIYFLSLAFVASIAGYFASGSFLSVLYYPHYWYLTALIFACRNIAELSLKSGRNERIDGERALKT